MVDQNHLEGLLDNLPSALVTLDDDGTVLYRNQAARNITPTIKPGMNIWDCLRPVINEEKIDRMLIKGERVIFAAGSDVPLLEWLLSEERLDDGSRILMAWDADILDEIVQRRITFVVGASHELRSPMTALLGFAEILNLEAETLSPSQAEAASVILQNAKYLHLLVEDILDLTRNSFGELRLDIEEVDLGPIIAGVVETLRPQVEDKDQTIQARTDPNLPLIEADAHRVRQAVLNLAQNAYEHSPAGSTIGITASTRDQHLVITVSDDGEGLPFDDPNEAFTEFESGATNSNNRVTGSGLGLTITKGIVELHRGSISVDSEEGVGTSFEILLPLNREEARKRLFAG
ncbi:MAG: sensor histidine kinase [Solirubrobacterales bacterium]